MEAAHSSKTLANFYQSTHRHRCENIKSGTFHFLLHLSGGFILPKHPSKYGPACKPTLRTKTFSVWFNILRGLRQWAQRLQGSTSQQTTPFYSEKIICNIQINVICTNRRFFSGISLAFSGAHARAHTHTHTHTHKTKFILFPINRKEDKLRTFGRLCVQIFASCLQCNHTCNANSTEWS
jgi:hypothetical protein